MCLIKNKKYHPFNRPLIAKEDIVCYKVLTRFYDDSPDIFRTPFQYEKIRVQAYLKYQIPFIAEDKYKLCSFWRHKLGFSRIVESGFIHTFTDIHPISLPISVHRALHRGEFVFKCIIPRGTKYFIGINNAYASKKIIFLEQLK